MSQGAIVTPNGMPLFHAPLWDLLQETFHRIEASLAQTDMAVKQGKAVDELRDRLVGFYGIADVRVENSVNLRGPEDMNVSLDVAGPLTPEQRSVIRRTLAEVNRRYGTQLRWFEAKEDKQDIKEGPQDVKKS